jgi:hypothetical protein
VLKVQYDGEFQDGRWLQATKPFKITHLNLLKPQYLKPVSSDLRVAGKNEIEQTNIMKTHRFINPVVCAMITNSMKPGTIGVRYRGVFKPKVN